MDNPKIGDAIKVPLNMLEREMAPSLFVVTFLISVGGYYLGAFFINLAILITAFALLRSYQT